MVISTVTLEAGDYQSSEFLHTDTFHEKMGTIKDRNGMDLTEAC